MAQWRSCYDPANVAAPCVADPVEVLERVPVAVAETGDRGGAEAGDGGGVGGGGGEYQADSFCARISAPTPRFFSFLVRLWCSATTVLKVVCSRCGSQPRAPHIARQRSLLEAWVQQLLHSFARAPSSERSVAWSKDENMTSQASGMVSSSCAANAAWIKTIGLRGDRPGSRGPKRTCGLELDEPATALHYICKFICSVNVQSTKLARNKPARVSPSSQVHGDAKCLGPRPSAP
jgi:hypothetical protein